MLIGIAQNIDGAVATGSGPGLLDSEGLGGGGGGARNVRVEETRTGRGGGRTKLIETQGLLPQQQTACRQRLRNPREQDCPGGTAAVRRIRRAEEVGQ